MTLQVRGVKTFNAQLRQASRVFVPKVFGQIKRSVALKALEGVVRLTPVDTGRARGGWSVGLGSRPRPVQGVLDPSGGGAIASGSAKIGASSPFQTIWIVNSVPYVSILENGGFVPANPGPSKDPRPFRKGRILVRRGYSIQSPQGMVKRTLRQLNSELRDIINRAVKR